MNLALCDAPSDFLRNYTRSRLQYLHYLIKAHYSLPARTKQQLEAAKGDGRMLHDNLFHTTLDGTVPKMEETEESLLCKLDGDSVAPHSVEQGVIPAVVESVEPVVIYHLGTDVGEMAHPSMVLHFFLATLMESSLNDKAVKVDSTSVQAILGLTPVLWT